MHKDWLGSARLISAISGHVVTSDQAYAPYGEMYATFGSANSQYDLFAGMTGNFNNGALFDTPNREFAQSDQGRWLSPDPARTGWNQYAYVENYPLSSIDPTGLACYPLELKEYHSCAPFMSNGVNFGASWNEFDLMGIPVVSTSYTSQFSPTGVGMTQVVAPDTGQITTLYTLQYGWTVTTTTTIVGTGFDLTSNPYGLGTLFAGIFYPGQNGGFQAARDTAKNFMKKPISNPSTIPGPPEAPPEWPGGFQSELTKLAQEALDEATEQVAGAMNDFLFVIDPCIINPRLMCGPNAPPQL
jgi:RHS repeat-associated protein